ncbi:MAG: general secretion pathway protein GspB [Gammaproteobacteria bacterium]|nr:general secretion pathway protein GspB [Gammaproteobacteria bacterium]
MSYILEALKKSDQKRKQGNVPDLQTIHIPLSIDAQPSRWPYVIIIVFLLMGLVFMIGWMRPWEQLPVNNALSENSDIKQVADNRINAVIAEKIKPGVEVDASEKEDFSQEMFIESAERRNTVEMKSNSRVVDNSEKLGVPHLDELPVMLQKAIPDMSFAGHVYSSSPNQRSVIINGSAMGEGDMILPELKIERITQNGVIFKYQSQLFRIDILQDWSFD